MQARPYYVKISNLLRRDNMPITVDIADRLYDYTDEEKAAEVVAAFQAENNLDDQATVALWEDQGDQRRAILEKLIFDAVDANGSLKRAQESVPCGVYLLIESQDA
jgi:hypothetical protein